jgi:hypothetical protein
VNEIARKGMTELRREGINLKRRKNVWKKTELWDQQKLLHYN